MIFKVIQFIIPLGMFFIHLQADQTSEAYAQASQKLEDSLLELSALRSEIQETRIPLSTKLSDLESGLMLGREQLLTVQNRQESNRVKFEILQKELSRVREQYAAILNTVNRYNHDLEAVIHTSELALYEEVIESARSVRIDSEAGLRSLETGLLVSSLQRLHDQLGGIRFTGDAILPDGQVSKGSFLILGPVEFFEPSEDHSIGVVFPDDTLIPHLSPIPEKHLHGITEVFETGKGVLPVDVTFGGVGMIDGQKESLFEHILKGGIWVWPILLSASIAFILSLWKAIQLYRIRLPEQGVIHQLLALVNAGKSDEAVILTKEIPFPVGDIMAEAVAHGDESPELVEEVMYESILNHQPALERGLSVVSMTAATAPLMGLLGTVTGMIHTFRLLEVFGNGDPKILSSGISEALVTTEFGLIVAIPALIMHGILARKVHDILSCLEKFSVVYINGLKAPSNRQISVKKGTSS